MSLDLCHRAELVYGSPDIRLCLVPEVTGAECLRINGLVLQGVAWRAADNRMCAADASAAPQHVAQLPPLHLEVCRAADLRAAAWAAVRLYKDLSQMHYVGTFYLPCAEAEPPAFWAARGVCLACAPF